MGLWDGGGETTQQAQVKEVWELGYEQEQSFTRTFQIPIVKGSDIHKSVCQGHAKEIGPSYGPSERKVLGCCGSGQSSSDRVLPQQGPGVQERHRQHLSPTQLRALQTSHF